ncbi:MAG: TonB-dependent receptor [Candidatus Thiosymbion ectosymbiont of Robbea hypermnestra]|nr:TonB-dependent receptor [Candidatus Thiosymbion ectosymbiont of Robbea hypermnestra]
MNTANLRAAIAVALAASSCLPANALASNAQDLAEVRQMIRQVKQQYEARIEALEERVRIAEQKAASARQTAPRSETQVPEVTKQVSTPTKTGDNSFNPAISFILQGGAATYSLDPDDYHMDGLPLGGEAGLHQEGLSLWETEMTASANIDNLFYGQTTIGLHQDDDELEVDLEEAFIDTLSLPAGLGLRVGRFYSDIGYLNAHHTHAWDFADAPLAYQAFLGKQYRDDGARATWVAPTEEVFVEVGAELLRGDAYPGGGNKGDLGAVKLGYIHIGGDIADNSSWQLGLSHMDVDVVSRTSGGHAHDTTTTRPSFVGDSRLSAIDLVWKSQFPGGRSLVLQGEYFLRDEDGQVTVSETAGNALLNYDGEQSGWYTQGIFQFAPRWRTGVRYDRMTADNNLAMVSNATGETNDDIFEESGFENTSHDPDRWTAMLDWSPTEFSRVRMQYAHDNSRVKSDNQFMLQYIMTLGAHGAHQY